MPTFATQLQRDAAVAFASVQYMLARNAKAGYDLFGREQILAAQHDAACKYEDARFWAEVERSGDDF